MEYLIRKARSTPRLLGLWDEKPWTEADTVELKHVHTRSSSHRPLTQARMLYSSQGLYAIFKVHNDRFIQCKNVHHQAMVCNDTAVELFLQPPIGEIPPGDDNGTFRGYFNFEINCGGWLLLRYNHQIDPKRGQASRHDPVIDELISTMKIHHTMPAKIDPEIPGPATWTVEFFMPFALFERVLGANIPLDHPDGWRGNFFKIAQQNSHPHWLTWSPIGPELAFHRPQFFGRMRLEQ